jgi:hypothetical protein
MTPIQGRRRRPTRNLCLAVALALAAAAPAAIPARALEVEVADEWEVDTASAALKGHVETSFALDTGSGFALTVAPKPEANRETDPDRLRSIVDRGAYVDTLELTWTGETTSVTVGKLTPNFGYASQVAPGISGDELAKSYELGERIGVAVQVGLSEEITLSASRFFRDTSLLGRSTATGHGRLRLADGGPGNTGRPDSTALALDFVPDELPGLHLHVAWLHQAAGRGDASGQRGWVAGAAQEIALGDVTVTPVVEYARSHDALGFAEAVSAPGARQDLLTLAIGVALDDWHAAAVWQRQDDRAADTPRFRAQTYEISVGYLLGDGLSADLGYRIARADGSRTSGISTRLGYRVAF